MRASTALARALRDAWSADFASRSMSGHSPVSTMKLSNEKAPTILCKSRLSQRQAAPTDGALQIFPCNATVCTLFRVL